MRAAALLLILTSAACGRPSGEFSALTYNVAGLPEGISSSSPERNSPMISPMLNRYDLVLVQEDFSYHALIAGSVEHPHRSVPKEPVSKIVADGLNRFSTLPFIDHQREAWTQCNGGLSDGSDCLSEKGFSVATHTLAEGMTVDIYNLHFDAGGDVEDQAARDAQVDQLLATIAARSEARAVIVGGDTNLKRRRDGDAPILDRLLMVAELADACVSVSCVDDDQIDRFLFRSSEDVDIAPRDWSIDEMFVDADGVELSDHPAIAVTFTWR